MAYANDLPNEILACIFEDCYDDDRLSTKRRERIRTMIRLVCQRWDEVLVSTPYCWSSLEIWVSKEGLPIKIPPTIIDLWLERSHNTKLSIVQLVQRDAWDAGPTNPLYKILSKHVARIRKLEFTMDHILLLSFLQELSWMEANNLESMNISQGSWLDSQIPWNNIFGFVERAPILKNFIFCWEQQVQFLPLRHTPNDTLNNLTNVDISLRDTVVPVEDIVTFLSQLMSAKKIGFRAFGHATQPPLPRFHPTSQITLHSLIILNLFLPHKNGIHRIYDVICSFIFPNLQFLQFSGTDPDGFVDFQRHIPVGLPQLKALCIYDQSLTASLLSDNIRYITRIRNVSINPGPFSQGDQTLIRTSFKRSGGNERIAPAEFYYGQGEGNSRGFVGWIMDGANWSEVMKTFLG